MAILEGIFIDQANELIKKLLKIIGHEIHLAWGLPEELQKLKDMLHTLTGMLNGVLGKPTTNEFMIMWLKKIKTVVYDVEDLLDEWSYEELEKKIKIQTTMTKKPISEQITAHEVETLVKSIEGILEEAMKYGIKPIEVVGGEVYEQSGGEREQILIDQRQFVDYKSLLGREVELKQIVALLGTAGKTNATLNVIAIVGMAALYLDNMTKLRYLPSQHAMSHLSNLNTVRFFRCPEFEENKMRENEEWHKICGLRNISFDDNSYRHQKVIIMKKDMSNISGFE